MPQCHTQLVLTPIHPCDGADYEEHWSPGVDIYIRQLRAWIGVDRDAAVDVGFSVWLSVNSQIVEFAFSDAWDHYANPTAPHSFLLALPQGDYFLLPAGGWVTFRVRGSLVTLAGQQAVAAHHQQSLQVVYSLTA